MRPDAPPPDADALARTAADPAAPAQQRDDACRALLPMLRRLARLAARRHGWGDADELVSWVAMRLAEGRLPPDADNFAAWCHRVMRHRFLDLLRRRRHDAPAPDEPPAAPDDRPRVEQALDAAAPFRPPDLERVRAWEPLRRILLLSRHRLWHKVPPPEWDGWATAVGLRPPFPPPGFDDWPDDERHAHLAAALGMPLNTLHQNWKRWKKSLFELGFVRGLRPGGEASNGRTG